MKLRKTIAQFRLDAISKDRVTMSDDTGAEYVLYVNDKINAVHEVNLTSAPDEKSIATLDELASHLIRLGFEELPGRFMQ